MRWQERSLRWFHCPTQVNSSLAAGIGTSQTRFNSPTYRPIGGDDISSVIREAIDEGESHGRVKATRWRSELWRKGTANCSSQTAAERGLWARASREDGESTRRSVTLLTNCLYHTGNNILRYLTLPPYLFIYQVRECGPCFFSTQMHGSSLSQQPFVRIEESVMSALDQPGRPSWIHLELISHTSDMILPHQSISTYKLHLCQSSC